MFERLRERIAHRRQAARAAAPPHEITAKCSRCGRTYSKPVEVHSTRCWWCGTLAAEEDDPYLDLGGGD